MKKYFSVLICLALVLPLSLIVESNFASAMCINPFSKTPKVISSYSETSEGSIVEPDCSTMKLPAGWSSVRSSARYNNTTSTGTKIYIKSGGRNQASVDFNKIVAPNVQIRKYVKDDGSVTFVKSPPEGDVRFYTSSSGSEPTLWWGKEKIRYID